ncbi:extracellular catalytic domain type 2 short-chain-length polyhydroxyalkanoate depolymerase [Bdellovibrio sp. BCCA]|uniref:extracellular catalytic domain type 2 short-chain-length polyhydroxyalkanoate depolymerase n=1 Tax=Bdellovibrio sp. BCCA TaxID=3136281 RepID=UPI0030F2FAF4
MSALFAILVTTLFASQPNQSPTTAPLGSWKIDRNSISISGVSSGGYMAVQMGVAYSKDIAAVASIAGGIYWCSEGDSQKAQSRCMGQPQGIDSNVQIAEARKLADEGQIDPLTNITRQKIYVYASPKDSVIHPLNSEKLEEFYKAFANPTQITTEKSIASAHGFPTLSSGNPCQMGFLPWLLKCNFDLAGEILKSAYGALNERGNFDPKNLLKFSQSDFGDEKTPLYKEGWVYVPSECQQGVQCRLHVALHGCQMNPDFIQDKFATLAGYNEWAETNRIIVLYPQSAKIPKDNPYACWDWFGFTGPNYMTKSGSQMSALKSMIEKAIQ